MKTKIIFFTILVCFFIFNKSYGQLLDETQIKVALVYQCAQNIQWQNENDFNTFKIAIYGNEKNIEKELVELSEITKIKNKKIEIIKLTNIDEINNNTPHVIFITSDNLSEQNKVYKKIQNKNSILLITDNSHSKENIMINFLNIGDKITFEINSNNIRTQKLSILPRLLLIGGEVGDIKDLYLNKEKELVDEKVKTQKYLDSIRLQEEKIAKQKKNIDEQKKSIAEQKNKIIKQNDSIKNQQIFLELQNKNIKEKQQMLSKLFLDVDNQSNLIENQNEVLEEKLRYIDNQEKEVEKKQLILTDLNKKIEEQNKNLTKKNTVIETQKRSLFLSIIFIIIGFAFIVFIYFAYKSKKKTNKLLKDKNHIINNKHEELQMLAEELRTQTEELDIQNTKLYLKNENISKSLIYASRIQNAMFPAKLLFSKFFSEHFILYKPRDVVSGDFYWAKKIENRFIYTAADCTGHGVPGAFVSMLGMSLLNEITTNNSNIEANQILNQLREAIKSSLKQRSGIDGSKDGMDIALCVIDLTTYKLQFAGANNSLYIINNKKLIEIKADRQPIGIYIRERSFTNHEFQLEKDDIIYSFSDGFIDQFGGLKGRKYMTKNFKNTLINIHQEPLEKQKILLNKEFISWSGNFDQIDDVVVVGTKI